MRARWIALVCVMVGAGMLSSSRAAGDEPAKVKDIFEGRWKVTMTPDDDARRDGEKPGEGTLIFRRGKFVARECLSSAFEAVEYEVRKRPGHLTFSAAPFSEKTGRANWTGFSGGKEIEGNVRWEKKDGTVANFSFKGARMGEEM
ncbi:MAG TPA: hypothetical protein VIL86_14300 [Tepidisphaeraceae bacterium]